MPRGLELNLVEHPERGELHGLGETSLPSVMPAIANAIYNATGLRVLDGLVTLGVGQRMSIMAGSGVGKSTLLGMIARNVRVDVNVICLVGERGREVREFLETNLGPEGLARSVLIVATSEQSRALQVKAPFLATTIAEAFRDAGLDVLLMVDSLTRLALAQRQIGLAAGEPPTTRGFTPSVFKAVSQSCVGGHNAHPDSPKKDFKPPDVMGGILLTIPLPR